MALVNCSDCGREVSDRAPACPGCGAPVAVEAPGGPERVRTSEDSALTRSRGCADLIIWPAVFLVILVLMWLASL